MNVPDAEAVGDELFDMPCYSVSLSEQIQRKMLSTVLLYCSELI